MTYISVNNPNVFVCMNKKSSILIKLKLKTPPLSDNPRHLHVSDQWICPGGGYFNTDLLYIIYIHLLAICTRFPDYFFCFLQFIVLMLNFFLSFLFRVIMADQQVEILQKLEKMGNLESVVTEQKIRIEKLRTTYETLKAEHLQLKDVSK